MGSRSRSCPRTDHAETEPESAATWRDEGGWGQAWAYAHCKQWAHGSAATPTHLDAQAVGACDDNAGRRFRDDDRTAHRRGRDRGGARDAGQGELELSVGEEVALRGGGGGRQPRGGRTSKTPRRLAQSSHRPHIAASDARILTLSHHGVLRLTDARASRKSSGERIEAALANSDDAAATMAATGTPRGTAANSWDGCGGREWVLEGARRSAERGRSKTCGQVRTWAEIGAGDSLRHSAPSFPGRERGAPFRTTRQSKARSSVDAKVCSLSILRVRVAESAPCTANSIGACSNLGGGCACKTRTCAPKSAEKYRAQTHHGGLRLPAARVRRAIWEHHAVDAKLGVVWLIPKVAAVRPAFDGGAVGRGEGFVEALVDPVPNEAALCAVEGGVRHMRRRLQEVRGARSGAPKDSKPHRGARAEHPPHSNFSARTCSDGYFLNASQ